MLKIEKTLLTIAVLLLIAFSSANALAISSCKSDTGEWVCERNKVCICEISGDCTNGNLIVYKTNVLDPLCLPEIIDTEVEIRWSDCQNPAESVNVRASCDEGLSSEKQITIPTTLLTTTTTNTAITMWRPTTTLNVTTTARKQSCPYECCLDDTIYEDEYCDFGYECVNNSCEKQKSSGKGRTIGIIILLIIIIAAGAFFLFRKKLKISF
jgi:hypothetical protein